MSLVDFEILVKYCNLRFNNKEFEKDVVMKIIIVLIVLTFTSLAYGQEEEEVKHFEEAYNLFENEKYDDALVKLKYIKENYSNSENKIRIDYAFGMIYLHKNELDNALSIFKNILEVDNKENEDNMSDLKHSVSQILSEIYFKKEQYDSSLIYLSISDTVYPYKTFCGNGYAENDINTSLKYSAIYQKMNEKEKALQSLLPNVFNDFADNTIVILELKNILKNEIGLKDNLDKALNSIYIKRKNYDGKITTRFYFNFLKTEIYVPNSYNETELSFEKEKAINYIKKSEFYKMISEL